MSDNKSEVALDFSLSSSRGTSSNRDAPISPPTGETAKSQLDAILDSHTSRHRESQLAYPGTLPGGISLAEYSASLIRAFPSSFLQKSMPPFYGFQAESCRLEAVNNSPKSPLSVVSEDNKDMIYWERRRKNNEAAKRSRDARRAKEDEITMRASMLEEENVRLKVEVATLKTETNKLRWLLYNG